MKKILAITGIRSDYDLMSKLLHRLHSDPQIDLELLVGGAHLSQTYGYSFQQIQSDGFKVLHSVESLIDSDTLSSRIKTASIMLQCSIDSVAHWQPDVIIYSGDREEVWIGALLGTYLEIPTVHFYGGDHTSTGHVDNPIRHAVSKMSTFHAVTIEEHRQRLLKIGEPDSRIRVIGNMSLDNFVSQMPIPFKDLCKEIEMNERLQGYAIVLFHPDPSEKQIAGLIFERILNTLSLLNIPGCVGFPNTDPSNGEIISIIKKYSNNKNFHFYRNLGRNQFISLYKHAIFIIGNSSSGIMEAASIPIPAINVGIRQVGRLAGENVVFCGSEKTEILAAINKILSNEFQKKTLSVKNPYGDGHSAEKGYRLLIDTDFNSIRLKKEDPLVL